MEHNNRELENKYESLRQSFNNDLSRIKKKTTAGTFLVSVFIFITYVVINIFSVQLQINKEAIENLFFTLFFMGIIIFLGCIFFKTKKDFKDEDFCISFTRNVPLIRPEDFQNLVDEEQIAFKFKNERVFRTKQGDWFKIDLRKYSQTLEIYKYAEHKIPIKNRISVNNSIKDFNGDI